MEELIISAEHEEKNYWKDLWSYRELLYFLAWKDILVRYKQTVVGVAWALLRPIINIFVMTVIFQMIAKMTSDPVPYPLFVCGGQLVWGLFASSFSDAGNSIVGNSGLISKIYFPRLLIPASTLAVGFVDFAISLMILGALMAWYHFIPDWRILVAPLFILLALIASLGAGLWMAALTVKYRDFRFIAPFIVQTGSYLSPVGYKIDQLHDFRRVLFSLNPMTGVINGFRWALFQGHGQIFWPDFVLSIEISIFMLVTAIIYFRKTEKSFADVI